MIYLNETTGKNGQLQVNISELLEKMAAECQVFHEHFDTHLNHLKSRVSEFASIFQALFANWDIEYFSLKTGKHDADKTISIKESSHNLRLDSFEMIKFVLVFLK